MALGSAISRSCCRVHSCGMMHGRVYMASSIDRGRSDLFGRAVCQCAPLHSTTVPRRPVMMSASSSRRVRGGHSDQKYSLTNGHHNRSKEESLMNEGETRAIGRNIQGTKQNTKHRITTQQAKRNPLDQSLRGLPRCSRRCSGTRPSATLLGASQRIVVAYEPSAGFARIEYCTRKPGRQARSRQATRNVVK